MISVIIPLYNKEVYIKQTIENVLKQSYQEFEILVVDDGSKDNGPAIVKSFTDSRIKLIQKINGGVSSARNVGIQNAKYEYIAFLDADDIWLPNHLEEIHFLISTFADKASLFATNFSRKYSDGRVVANRDYKEINRFILNNYYKTIFNKPIIHTSCVCVKKGALLSVGMFDERFSNGEDIELWGRLSKKFKIAISSKVTEFYLMDAINNSKKKIDRKKTSAYYTTLSNCDSIYEFILKLKSIIKFRVKLLLKYYY